MSTTTTPETKAEAERRRKAEYNARRTAARRAAAAAAQLKQSSAEQQPVQPKQGLTVETLSTRTLTEEEAAKLIVAIEAETGPLDIPTPRQGTTPLEKVMSHVVDDGAQGDAAKAKAVQIVRSAAAFLRANPGQWGRNTLAFDATQTGARKHVYGMLKSNINLAEVRVCALGACALVSDNVSIDYPQHWTTDREVGRIINEDILPEFTTFNDNASGPGEVADEMERRAFRYADRVGL